MKTTFMAVNSR